MAIVHVRIDDRLIHGQVAVVWTNTIGADRIMVVNDEVANDDMQKSILKMATPPGIKLSVLTIEKAANRIKEGRYDNDKVFMVIRDPKDCIKLINRGVNITKINVGNMGKKKNTTQIKKTVNITKEHLNSFIELDKMGVDLTARMIPNEEETKLMDFIKEKGLI